MSKEKKEKEDKPKSKKSKAKKFLLFGLITAIGTAVAALFAKKRDKDLLSDKENKKIKKKK